MNKKNILIIAASILIMNKLTAQDTMKVTGNKILDLDGVVSNDVIIDKRIQDTTKVSDIKVIDIDGNVYNTVTIGKQIWMNVNLKVTRLNDNTLIPLETDGTKWANLKTPGYCWYNNDTSKIKTNYGALYNWYTVNTGKLCPAGWHVPTDNEWSILVSYLGGDRVAGGKLKEVGRTHWKTTNLLTTNTTNFTAIPSGYRNDLQFRYFGKIVVWWTTTEFNTEQAWYRHLNNYLGVGNYIKNKTDGFSVRCLKD